MLEKNKEVKLMSCKTLKEFMTMYFGFGIKEQLSIFNQPILIKKGSILYRLRRDDGKTNFYDAKEWGLPPKNKVKQGRVNSEYNPILYLGTEEFFLGREIGLQNGERYYVAKYVCEKDFYVGSLFSTNSTTNTIIHKLFMSIKKENLTEQEKRKLKQYKVGEGNITVKTIYYDQLSCFYIDSLLDNLYNYTNRITKLILKKYKNGLRYDSAYAPLSISGQNKIITFDGMEHGNIALTEEGIINIKLVSVVKKKYSNSIDLGKFIEIYARQERQKNE